MDYTTHFCSSIRHEGLEPLNPTFLNHTFFTKKQILIQKKTLRNKIYPKNTFVDQKNVSETKKTPAAVQVLCLRKKFLFCIRDYHFPRLGCPTFLAPRVNFPG